MQYKTLGEICDVVSGGTPSRSKQEYWNGDIPWIKIGNIKSKYVSEADEFITEAGLSGSSAKMLKKGTILYTIFATLGEAGVLTIDACTNQAIAGISIKDESVIDRDYLFYYLKSKKNYVNEVGRGVAQNNINMSILRGFEVPIRKLYEQQEITKILDKTASIIEDRKKELDKLDELIKARFVEMFFDKGYPVLGWNDVFNTITGKLDSNAMVEDGEYPFFTCAKEVFRIDKYAFDQEALLLAGNNAAGKYDVKYYKGKFNAYQRTYVLGLKQNWSYRLFQYQLEDKLVYLQQQSLGGLTKYLTMKILGDLSFIIPPMDKQIEFEQFVKQVDKSEVAVQMALDETQTLFDCLMQEYFG